MNNQSPIPDSLANLDTGSKIQIYSELSFTNAE